MIFGGSDADGRPRLPGLQQQFRVLRRVTIGRSSVQRYRSRGGHDRAGLAPEEVESLRAARVEDGAWARVSR